MSWGGLNAALTAWRNAYRRRFPDPPRDTASDGARADGAHSSASQHQEDADGTVDANDMDVNLLGSRVESGSPRERALLEAMKLDFERDPHGRGQLWIHNREIANRDIGPWTERAYSGANPHDRHVHWESRQSREDNGAEWPMPATDALLGRYRMDDVIKALESDAGQAAIARAAGVGVHNQRLGRSEETIGQDLQGDDNAPIMAKLEEISTRLAALEAPLPE